VLLYEAPLSIMLPASTHVPPPSVEYSTTPPSYAPFASNSNANPWSKRRYGVPSGSRMLRVWTQLSWYSAVLEPPALSPQMFCVPLLAYVKS
jgi:hypothetical protein